MREIEEMEAGKKYLVNLLKIVSPECEPCNDLSGLISQIDNYTAGQKIEIERLKKEFKERCEHCSCKNRPMAEWYGSY